MRQSSGISVPAYAPASLHQLRRALVDTCDALEIEGLRIRGADYSLYFERVSGNIVRPLMSVWFNVERRQYTLMCRTTIITPGRPMGDTCTRLATHLGQHARRHGWHQASRLTR
ncbi:hypothetical protein M1D97_01160 [Kushneria sp. AK178]